MASDPTIASSCATFLVRAQVMYTSHHVISMQDSSFMSPSCNHCFQMAEMCLCSTGPPRQWLFGNIPETLKEGGIYK